MSALSSAASTERRLALAIFSSSSFCSSIASFAFFAALLLHIFAFISPRGQLCVDDDYEFCIESNKGARTMSRQLVSVLGEK